MQVACHDTKEEKASCFVRKVVRTYTAWHLTSIMRHSRALGEHNIRRKEGFPFMQVCLPWAPLRKKKKNSRLGKVKRRSLPPVPSTPWITENKGVHYYGTAQVSKRCVPRIRCKLFSRLDFCLVGSLRLRYRRGKKRCFMGAINFPVKALTKVSSRWKSVPFAYTRSAWSCSVCLLVKQLENLKIGQISRILEQYFKSYQ